MKSWYKLLILCFFCILLLISYHNCRKYKNHATYKWYLKYDNEIINTNYLTSKRLKIKSNKIYYRNISNITEITGNKNKKFFKNIDYKKVNDASFANQNVYQLSFKDEIKNDFKNSFYNNTFNIIPSKNVWLKVKGHYTIDLNYGSSKRIYISEDFLSGLEGKKRSNFLFENAESSLFLKGFNFFQTFSFEVEGLVNDEFNAKVFSDSSSDGKINYKAEWTPKKVATIKYIKIENKENIFDRKNIYAENNYNENNNLKDVFSLKVHQELFNFNLETFFNLSFNKRETLEFNGFSREEKVIVKDSEFFKRRFFNIETDNPYLIDNIELFEETYSYNYDIEIITDYKNAYGENISITNRFNKIKENSFYFDRKNKVLDIRFEADKRVILFFTENGKSILNKEIYSRENAKYTTLTNTNASSIKVLSLNNFENSTNELYKNFAVLSDPYCENEKNPFELRNYYPLPENIDTLTIDTSLIFSDESEIAFENRHSGLSDGHFNTTGSFSFNYKEGNIFFHIKEPFARSDSKIKNEDIYKLSLGTIKDNSEKYSKYKIVYKYKTHQNGYYKLRNNIVDGSVNITVNGIALKNSDYKVDYKNGIITFNNNFLIKQNDKVIISYSYSENSSSSFTYNVGSRLSYNIDKKNEIGFGVIYRGTIDSGKTVYIDSSPDANLLLIADFNFDLPYLFNKKTNNFNFIINGGYAYSIYDKNTRNSASIFNIAENSEIISLSKNENIDLFFTQNPVFENKSFNLGYLYFIDLKDYNNVLNTKWRDLNYENINKIKREAPEQIKNFSIKVGPYIAKNSGHKIYGENTKADAIIFDYDFSEENNYVSVVNGFNKINGIDASEYNEIEIVASLIPMYDKENEKYFDPKKINIMLELGQPTEDFDNDKIFDSEKNEYCLGYNFNYKENTIYERCTILGAGVKGSSSKKVEEANNRLDKEDLNNDNISYSIDNTVIFPSKETVDYFNQNLDILEIPTLDYYNQNKNNYENTFYKIEYIGDNFFKINIKIKNNLDIRTKEILKKSLALRFTIFEKEKTKGRLIVSYVHFKKNVNENIYLDSKKPNVNNNFLVSTINSSYSDKLRSGKKIVDDKDWFKIYSSLHGKLNLNERRLLKENAIRFEYNLNGEYYSLENENNTKEAVLFLKQYEEKYDLSIYKEFSFFIYKEVTSRYEEEYFLFGLGESEEKYLSIKIPFVLFDRKESLKGGDNMDSQTAWNKVTIFLNDNNSFSVSINNGEKIESDNFFYKNGKSLIIESVNKRKVSLEKISVFIFGVGVKNNYKARGAFWINELYVNNDKKIKGHAWNIESLVNYKNIDINGFSLVSNFNITYMHKYIGVGFASLNSKPSEKEINLDALTVSSGFLKNMIRYSFIFSYEENFDESFYKKKIFSTGKEIVKGYNSFTFNIDFISPIKYIPNLSHSYSEKQDTKNYMFLDSSDNYVLKNNSVFTKVLELKENYNITNLFSLKNINLKQSFFVQGVIEKITHTSFFYLDYENLKTKNYFAFTKKKLDREKSNYEKISSSNYILDARYTFRRKDGLSFLLEIKNILYLDFYFSRDISFFTHYKSNENKLNEIYGGGYFKMLKTIFNYNNIIGTVGREKIKGHFVSEKDYNIKSALQTGFIKYIGELYLELSYLYREHDFEYNVFKYFDNIDDDFNNKQFEETKYIDSKNTFSKTGIYLSFDLFSLNKSKNYKDTDKEKNDNSSEEIFYMPISFYRELSIFENDVLNSEEYFLKRHFETSSKMIFKFPFHYSEFPFFSFIKNAIPESFKNSMKRHNSSDEVKKISSTLNDGLFSKSYYSDIVFENGYNLDFIFKYFDNVHFALPNKLSYEYKQKTLKLMSDNFYQYEYIYIFTKHSLDLNYIFKNFLFNQNKMEGLKYTAFSYELGYKRNILYREKIIEDSFVASFSLNHPFKSFEAVLNFTYEFVSSREYLNHNEDNIYLGIGKEGKNNLGVHENNNSLTTPQSLSKKEHIISFDLRFNFYQSINKGVIIDFIKSQINIIHSISISIPFFNISKFDDKITFYLNDISYTSETLFDLKNINIAFDNIEDFLFIKPSYIFTLSSTRYFSINSYLSIPMLFTKYYKTSYEYKSMNRFDIKIALEIGFSLTLSY